MDTGLDSAPRPSHLDAEVKFSCGHLGDPCQRPRELIWPPAVVRGGAVLLEALSSYHRLHMDNSDTPSTTWYTRVGNRVLPERSSLRLAKARESYQLTKHRLARAEDLRRSGNIPGGQNKKEFALICCRAHP